MWKLLLATAASLCVLLLSFDGGTLTVSKADAYVAVRHGGVAVGPRGAVGFRRGIAVGPRGAVAWRRGVAWHRHFVYGPRPRWAARRAFRAGAVIGAAAVTEPNWGNGWGVSGCGCPGYGAPGFGGWGSGAGFRPGFGWGAPGFGWNRGWDRGW